MAEQIDRTDEGDEDEAGSRARAERWLQKFFHFFAAPSPESYAPLFHPEGSLQDAGMAEPLPAAQTGAAIAMVLAKVPDLLIRPLRHAVRGNHVFVEARNTGSLGGAALDWGALYRVHLKDGLVHRGRRFYDQVELFRPVLPDGAALPAFPGAADAPVTAAVPPANDAAMVDRLAEAWNGAPAALAALYAPEGRHLGPGLAAPLPRGALPAYQDWLRTLLSPAPVRAVDWASAPEGNGRILFVEFHGNGRFLGEVVPLDRIDRYLLDAGGRILDSRSYMDTLGLVERAKPEVAAIRAAVIRG